MLRGLLLVSLLCFAPFSFAKDLTSRLGVGYADQFGVEGGLPSVAVRYFPNSQLGVSGQIGVDTKKDYAKFGAMAKVFRIIFMEENLNFYMGAGAGMISRELPGESNESGFELSGFFWGGVLLFRARIPGF